MADIGIFSSKGNEGFPNVIAEKMLTKIPCIVSDVGDAARIIGKNGCKIENNCQIFDKIFFSHEFQRYDAMDKFGWKYIP